MDIKFIIMLISGIIIGYVLCLLLNKKHTINDVLITHPASW
jgi:uncharacterized membrane-anchored protein YhcB (DUF1043 family)